MKVMRRQSDRMPLANLSKKHPDYGKTHAEHAILKAQRAAGKLPFIDKKTGKPMGKARRKALGV